MNFINILEFTGWVCDNSTNSIKPVLHLVKEILNILRIVVPIGLIFMTTFDITKKVINPDDKEGQKKIMIRAIAALIVFLVPTIVNISLKVIDWGTGKDVTSGYGSLSSCWKNA